MKKLTLKSLDIDALTTSELNEIQGGTVTVRACAGCAPVRGSDDWVCWDCVPVPV
jgi:hypothetical protein